MRLQIQADEQVIVCCLSRHTNGAHPKGCALYFCYSQLKQDFPANLPVLTSRFISGRALFQLCPTFMKLTKIFGISSGEWNAMSFYGRFEQIVTWILTLCIAVIIAIALFRLVATIFQLLVFGALNPLNHEEFEVIFGMIMTLLIAMEFNHSILQAMERLHRVIQVKTVILISILALARKFIILNMEATPALTIVALGFAVIALGVVYWLLREREDRSAAEAKANRVRSSKNLVFLMYRNEAGRDGYQTLEYLSEGFQSLIEPVLFRVGVEPPKEIGGYHLLEFVRGDEA